MRVAILDPTGLVTNVVLADDPDDLALPDDHTALVLTDEPCGPGWRLNDGDWTEPDPPPPPPPTAEEIRAAMQTQIDELADLVLMQGLML